MYGKVTLQICMSLDFEYIPLVHIQIMYVIIFSDYMKSYITFTEERGSNIRLVSYMGTSPPQDQLIPIVINTPLIELY